MSLNSTQLSNIDRIIGAKSLCSAVVRLYRTTGDDWEYTGIVGAAAISRKNGFATISFVDLESQSELFAEELYYNFNYQTPKPFFHYFEVQDCVAGFSFADDGEAGNFSLQVNNNKPSKSQPPPINTPPPTTTVQQPSRPPPPKQTPTPTPTTNTISAPSSQDKGKKKEKGGGFFSKLFGGAKKEEEVHEISGPTNFRHESHIGWDPVNGFDIRNIPPAWKELFKKAGVKKSDLQDKDTAKLVMETIVENIGGPPQNTPPPPSYPNQSTPPPPPPRGGNNTGGESFQTPPPPPTMDMGSNAPPPPTPPPPMPMDSGNAPPPPMPPPSFSDDKPSAPPRGGGGGGNAPLSFAEQLKNKQTSGLKTVDRPVENLPQLPEDTGGLANALASALKNRRGAIEEDRDSDDHDSGDEWSD